MNQHVGMFVGHMVPYIAFQRVLIMSLFSSPGDGGLGRFSFSDGRDLISASLMFRQMGGSETHMLHGAGIFANICPKKHPNVGKYTIH